MKLTNAVLLSDNEHWKNRIKFNDPRPVVIAQNILTGNWACTCQRWIAYRTCKHEEMVAGQTVEETVGE